jgi:hypothetical protein
MRTPKYYGLDFFVFIMGLQYEDHPHLELPSKHKQAQASTSKHKQEEFLFLPRNEPKENSWRNRREVCPYFKTRENSRAKAAFTKTSHVYTFYRRVVGDSTTLLPAVCFQPVKSLTVSGCM